MELVAHRGCAAEYPENTLHALERAARQLPAVELDVRRCASGELVVHHDETVDRVTDGSGRVADLNWSDLRGLEVLDSGEGIPLLSEALAAIPPGVTAQVELKGTGVGADAVATVADSGVDARITSFSAEALAEVREATPGSDGDAELGPDVPLGYLFGDGVGVEAGLETARELGCEYLHPHADLCLATDVVERARAEGMVVVAWGADDRATFDGLRAAGVDGATADSWTLAGVGVEADDEAATAD